jgi:hypothetical protein
MNPTKVYVLDESGTTPFNVWAGAIILGLILILISFLHFPAGEEALVSIFAWIPIGYAMVTSFAVDTISGAGVGAGLAGTTDVTSIEVHTVHHFDVIAVILFIVLAFAIGNTWRIAANQKRMSEMAQPEQSWHERNRPGGMGE